MKSLSMPDHLDSFAQDVAEMKQRLETNHHASKQNEEGLTSCYSPGSVREREEGDFFVRGIDIDDDDDDTDSDGTAEDSDLSNKQQEDGGYLPIFDYSAFNSSSNGMKNGIRSYNSLRLSERIPSVATVHEEEDDVDDGGDDENQDIELEKQQEQQQQNAQAAIAELADLFAFPRQLHDDDDYDSNSSHQTQQKKIHPGEASPTCVTCNLDSPTSTPSSQQPKAKAKPASTGKSKSRRSIFGQLADKYAWRPNQASVEPEEGEYFTRLSQDARAQSLPACPAGSLPRKGSLKRISSLYSQTNSDTGSSSSLKRTVSFSSLNVREYNIALSDHPSCSYGPPIQLGWDYRQKKAVQVEDYEEVKLKQPRRSRHDMVLSYNVRRYLLLKRAGYSDQDLEEAMSEVERVKRERVVTGMFLPASKLDETMEYVFDRVKTTFGGGSEPRY
jgi:hypothetical protein